MKQLLDLLKCKEATVYPESTQDYVKYQLDIDDFADDVKHSLRRQFLCEEQTHPPLRLSSLGKTPAFELLGKKLGLIEQGSKHTVNEGLKLIFSLGDWFETYLIFMLRRAGYSIISQQDEVKWNGVTGHIDVRVMGTDGIEHLLEIKSANDWYASDTFKRGYPLDDRGYLTQLLTYAECLEIPRERSHWVMWNKNTGEIRVMDLSNVPEDVASERLIRGKRIVDAYRNCETPADLYSTVKPPPPAIEMDKNHKPVLDDNGQLKLYVPSVVNHPDFCYKIVEGKTRWGKKRDYVIDYNYPDEFSAYKPDIFRDSRRFYNV